MVVLVMCVDDFLIYSTKYFSNYDTMHFIMGCSSFMFVNYLNPVE